MHPGQRADLGETNDERVEESSVDASTRVKANKILPLTVEAARDGRAQAPRI
jgi:hypothetical protein